MSLLMTKMILVASPLCEWKDYLLFTSLALKKGFPLYDFYNVFSFDFDFIGSMAPCINLLLGQKHLLLYQILLLQDIFFVKMHFLLTRYEISLAFSSSET